MCYLVELGVQQYSPCIENEIFDVANLEIKVHRPQTCTVHYYNSLKKPRNRNCIELSVKDQDHAETTPQWESSASMKKPAKTGKLLRNYMNRKELHKSGFTSLLINVPVVSSGVMCVSLRLKCNMTLCIFSI